MNTKQKITVLQQKQESLQAEIDSLKAEYASDWPQIGDAYYTYLYAGEVPASVHAENSLSNNRKLNATCFRSRKAAELSRDQDKCMRMLRAMADGGEYILRRLSGGTIIKPTPMIHAYGLPTFSTQETAQTAIDTIGEELLNTLFDGGVK